MVAPVVVLEATGHYHRALVRYLERGGWKYFIINPLQSKRAKGTQLRKVKTDAADAWHLADMYYRGTLSLIERGKRRTSNFNMSRGNMSSSLACLYNHLTRELC